MWLLLLYGANLNVRIDRGLGPTCWEFAKEMGPDFVYVSFPFPLFFPFLLFFPCTKQCVVLGVLIKNFLFFFFFFYLKKISSRVLCRSWNPRSDFKYFPTEVQDVILRYGDRGEGGMGWKGGRGQGRKTEMRGERERRRDINFTFSHFLFNFNFLFIFLIVPFCV